jgi:hypothetical protein
VLFAQGYGIPDELLLLSPAFPAFQAFPAFPTPQTLHLSFHAGAFVYSIKLKQFCQDRKERKDRSFQQAIHQNNS